MDTVTVRSKFSKRDIGYNVWVPDKRKPRFTTCPYCDATTRQVRNGKNRSGTRRTICLKCGGHYTNAPKPRYRADTIRVALVLYSHVENYRRVARLLNVNHQTVINWHQKYGNIISSLLDTDNPLELGLSQRVARLLEKDTREIKQEML